MKQHLKHVRKSNCGFVRVIFSWNLRLEMNWYGKLIYKVFWYLLACFIKMNVKRFEIVSREDSHWFYTDRDKTVHLRKKKQCSFIFLWMRSLRFVTLNVSKKGLHSHYLQLLLRFFVSSKHGWIIKQWAHGHGCIKGSKDHLQTETDRSDSPTILYLGDFRSVTPKLVNIFPMLETRETVLKLPVKADPHWPCLSIDYVRWA